MALASTSSHVAALSALFLLACSGGRTDPIDRMLGTGGRDAAIDAGEAHDAAVGQPEAAPPDAAELDAAPDAAEPDAAEPDAAEPDAAEPDAAVPLTPGAIAPTPYLIETDSPFADVQFDWFYLEDFEDHALNTPGLVSQGVLSSSFSIAVVDSVDEDDGIPDDNQCVKIDGYCDAWWGPGTLTFTFDAQVLGALPTHVGAVWTDGGGQVSFEAFGPDGLSLYRIGPFSEPGFPDDTIQSSTAEDRFFGVFNPGGISAITVSNTAGGVEVDHVQYGRAP